MHSLGPTARTIAEQKPVYACLEQEHFRRRQIGIRRVIVGQLQHGDADAVHVRLLVVAIQVLV